MIKQILLTLILFLSIITTPAYIPSQSIHEDFLDPYQVSRDYYINFPISKIHDGSMYVDEYQVLINETYQIDNIQTKLNIPTFGVAIGIGLYANDQNYISVLGCSLPDGNFTIRAIGMTNNNYIEQSYNKLYNGNFLLQTIINNNGDIDIYMNNTYVNSIQFSILPTTFMIGNGLGSSFNQYDTFGYKSSHIEYFDIESSYKNIVVVTETQTETEIINHTLFNTEMYNYTEYITIHDIINQTNSVTLPAPNFEMPLHILSIIITFVFIYIVRKSI